MKQINGERRSFIRQMLAVSIVTAACPHILLSKEEPKIISKGDNILGIYKITFDKYPQLNDVWGSVRIRIENEFIPPDERPFPSIIVTHLDKEKYGGQEFSCVLEICPHEGYTIYDLRKIEYVVDDQWVTEYEFECPGHGTIFAADGSYKSGPAAQDLVKYGITYDGGQTLSMEIPVVSSVKDETQNLTYLRQNSPNPAVNLTSIEYGVEKPARITIELVSMQGNSVKVLTNKLHTGGHYNLRVDLSDVQPGAYFIKMSGPDISQIIKKMIITK